MDKWPHNPSCCCRAKKAAQPRAAAATRGVESSAQRVWTRALNPYSWLSLPPHCRSGAWAASPTDGKASRMLLGSGCRAEVFSDKDLGLGFSPVGYRQQIHALLILPSTKPPARRLSSKPNGLSKGSRRQLAECARWQGPAWCSVLSEGLRGGVEVVQLLRGAGSRPGCRCLPLSMGATLALSLRGTSSFLCGCCSVNWGGLFIFPSCEICPLAFGRSRERGWKCVL